MLVKKTALSVGEARAYWQWRHQKTPAKEVRVIAGKAVWAIAEKVVQGIVEAAEGCGSCRIQHPFLAQHLLFGKYDKQIGANLASLFYNANEWLDPAVCQK
mmetsp:Transcript_6063/g.9314  ORF Transcript_6063/g.9314 Transcript_6063/m.9314 type:complete len:101 (-) Transcript_6063:25-327(-)